MTLSSNLPSAEPTTLPSDPFACLGVAAQTTVAASAGTPFATLLTEAGPAPTDPSVAIAADSKSVASGATPLPSTPTPVICWSAEFLGFYPADESTVSVKEAAPQADVAQSPTTPVTYPGIRYMANAAVQTLPLAPVVSPAVNVLDTNGTPITAQPPSLVQPQGQPQSPLTTVVASAQNVQSQVTPQAVPVQSQAVLEAKPVQEPKPRAATLARAKEQKQGSAEGDTAPEKPTNADASSGDPASQGTALLVYQLVAGQWVPQPVVQPSVQEQVPVQKGDLNPEPSLATEGMPVVTGEIVAPDRQSAVPAISQPVAFSDRNSVPVQAIEKRKSLVQKAPDTTQSPGFFASSSTSTAAVEPQNTNSPAAVPTTVQPSRAETPKDTQVLGAIAVPNVTRIASKEAAAEIQLPASIGVAAATVGSNQRTNLPVENQKVAPGDTVAVPNKLPAPETEKPISTSLQVKGVSENQKDLSPVAGSNSSSDGAGFQPQPDATTFRTVADLRAQFGAPEKFAAPQSVGRAESPSGVIPPTELEEKKTLVIDDKKVNSIGHNVGTSAANRDISMPYSAVNKSSAAEVIATPHVSSPSSVRADSLATTTATSTSVAVQAPRLVQEIHEIADRISTIDRNTVEVRFDFSESDHLSVRVEYREGTVHTTFRTDSTQLREAISHEWVSQSPATEQRSYRLAEPVFSTNSSTQQNLSSSGNGSGYSRSQEQPTNSSGAGFSLPGRSSSFSSSSSSSASTAQKSVVRPETSRHLHTFA